LTIDEEFENSYKVANTFTQAHCYYITTINRGGGRMKRGPKNREKN
jgi:hypothetical protein